ATPDALLRAATRMRELGYGNLDAHTPYPVPGLSQALGLPRSRVSLFAGLGGLTGVSLGYLMQWFANAWDYRINVGGRAAHAAPSFIPITFELGVLLGAFGAFFGALALMRLPRPYHPAFEVDAFLRASDDRFWLSIGFEPPEFEKKEATNELRRL